MLDHLFGDVEVGDHTVPHRADGLDRARRPAKHELCVFADGQHFLDPVLYMVGDDRRLRQNDPTSFDIDQRVRRAEVNRHIRRKQSTETRHIYVSRLYSGPLGRDSSL